MGSTLHITNGDIAAKLIRDFDPDGVVIPWRDVLHEGPLHTHTRAIYLAERARFIAGSGWAEDSAVRAMLEERDAAVLGAARNSQVVLWFEPDLYDQLQLLDVASLLSCVTGAPPIHSIEPGMYLGTARPEQLPDLFAGRRRVLGDELSAAHDVWFALGDGDPRSVEAALARATPFRYVGSALRRFFEELPWMSDSLSRLERAVLVALSDGASALRDVFRMTSQSEEWVFCGDSAWMLVIDRLSTAPALVTAPARNVDGQPRWESPLSLTELGRSALNGSVGPEHSLPRERWWAACPIDPATPYRWDGDRSLVVRLD